MVSEGSPNIKPKPEKENVFWFQNRLASFLNLFNISLKYCQQFDFDGPLQTL